MEAFEEKLKQTALRLGLTIEQIPRHIAIIMDGNGRWAIEKGLPRIEGHRRGGKTVERIAKYCIKTGIEALTLYSFSTENWKRPKEEVNSLMFLYTQYLKKFRPTFIENNVRVIHLGHTEHLPSELQNVLKETIELTADNAGMRLVLALNYSGRVEISDAARKIAEEYKKGLINLEQIDEGCVRRHLYEPTLTEPDLLIRTANEKRISNFLLWQISYSEFYITETYWPDFTEEDLDRAILEYAHRQRRFGDIKPAGRQDEK